MLDDDFIHATIYGIVVTCYMMESSDGFIHEFSRTLLIIRKSEFNLIWNDIH